jgi:hypothetical protein
MQSPPLPSLDDKQKHETLLSVREVVASYAMHWHKLSIDSTIFIATGCLALSGFVLTRTDTSHKALIFLSALVVIFGWVGAYLSRLIEKNTKKHWEILLRLDHLNQLLEPDVFMSGKSIYPNEWKNTGDLQHRDPIFRFCFSFVNFRRIGAISLSASSRH